MMPYMLEQGMQVPPFTALDQNGNEISLESYKGGWVLVWWYVKASTPG
jgi:peroxiredoxin Q/BCP